MNRLDNNNAHKNDGARIQDFKQFQAIPDTTIDALEDFEWWVTDEMPDATDEQIDFVHCAVAMFLNRDSKSEEQHKIAEQRLLEIWTKSCGKRRRI